MMNPTILQQEIISGSYWNMASSLEESCRNLVENVCPRPDFEINANFRIDKS